MIYPAAYARGGPAGAREVLNFAERSGCGMEPLRHTSGARFGAFEVWFDSGELHRAGLKIRVQQQPLKLLQILLEHRGEVVSREYLRNQLWANEGFGDFDQAVNIAIGKLRTALGDSAENPRYIETLPKRGYRFIAEVSIVDSDAPGGGLISRPPEKPGPTSEPSELNPGPPGGALQVSALTAAHKARRWTTHRGLFAMVPALGVLIFAVWLAVHWVQRPAGIRSLAVLPLDNFSGDVSQDYFADGMTDEVINELAQIRALRVVSRPSVMTYSGTRKPLPEIARELKVDAVVEGSVLRFGDQVRITAQLVQVPADKHLWAASYQGNVRDTLALQDQV